jgi:hypothetical protein
MQEGVMRHLVLLLVLCVLAADVPAQEQTLLKSGHLEKTGFGGPVIKFTSVHDQGAVMVGGRGGWIFNHSMALGGGLYGVVNEVDAPKSALPLEGPLDIEFGYGGFEAEYVLHSNSLIHSSFYALIGGGVTNFVKDTGSKLESNEQAGESHFMFVLEPAVNAELNVITWFRINAGISYRLTIGANQEGLDDSDFSGLTGSITFKFGRF